MPTARRPDAEPCLSLWAEKVLTVVVVWTNRVCDPVDEGWKREPRGERVSRPAQGRCSRDDGRCLFELSAAAVPGRPPPTQSLDPTKGRTNPAEMAKNNPTGSPSPRTLAASGHADQSDRGQPISVRGRPQTHGRPAAYGSTLIITRVQKRLVRPLYILDERPQTPAVSRKAGPLCTRLSFTTVHDGRDPLLAVFDVLHVVPSLSPLPPVADRPRPLAS